MATPDKKEANKAKMAALLKLQNTNGSFELTEAFCKAIGLGYAVIKKEMEDRRLDQKAWATALAMEYIDSQISSAKAENIKEFDKAKLFVYKVWAHSQANLKKAAMEHFVAAGGSEKVKGVDGDRRPIV